ncbi:hypothetical protein GWI33_009110 [Rhynchophorus ferrugineus]|uniref:Uncharacterized protein n=1 Tax=Rhynchophorus ferrugineus TaxID=354439 RepID=A0A834MAJ3_RHYFE|nr:hypothetical protein GWI33_009110 [Rhynchophorus ferrugineus]
MHPPSLLCYRASYINTLDPSNHGNRLEIPNVMITCSGHGPILSRFLRAPLLPSPARRPTTAVTYSRRGRRLTSKVFVLRRGDGGVAATVGDNKI